MSSKNAGLSPSLEDYLETILLLEAKNRVARVKDIAANMDVQMSSVTSALKNLRDRNLVNYEKNSFISLTPKGKKIAETIREKHDIIKEFLHSVLMLPKSDSDAAACEIEHAISTDTALRLRNCSLFIADYLEKSGISGKEWEIILSE